MSSIPAKSAYRWRLPLIGYGIGLAVCLAVWVGVFAGTRYVVNETWIGKVHLVQAAGLPEGRSTAVSSSDRK